MPRERTQNQQDKLHNPGAFPPDDDEAQQPDISSAGEQDEERGEGVIQADQAIDAGGTGDEDAEVDDEVKSISQ